MSLEKSKKNLINWDLVTVNPNNKNWNWKDLFCYWGVSIQSVIGFSLITSLYVVYNLNAFVVFIDLIFLIIQRIEGIIFKPCTAIYLKFFMNLKSISWA